MMLHRHFRAEEIKEPKVLIYRGMSWDEVKRQREEKYGKTLTFSN